MQAASPWLAPSQRQSACGVANRRTCRAHGHRVRHVPANQQQGVQQASCAPSPAVSTAAAAASMQHMLDLQHLQLDVQEFLTERRHGHTASESRKTRKPQRNSSYQLDHVPPASGQEHDSGVGCSSAETRSSASAAVAAAAVDQGIAANESRLATADIAVQQSRQQQLQAVQQQSQLQHQSPPTVQQQPALQEEQELHVLQEQRHIHYLDGVVTALVQEEFLQDSHSPTAAAAAAVDNSWESREVRYSSSSSSVDNVQQWERQLGQQQSVQQHWDLQQQPCAVHGVAPDALENSGSNSDAADAQRAHAASLLQQQEQQQQQQNPAQNWHQQQQQQQQCSQRHQANLVQQQDQLHQQQQQHWQYHSQQQQQLHWQHQARLQQQQATAWLSQQIAAAASWREVQSLLDKLESDATFSPRHVVQLLLRLEQLVLQQKLQQQQQGVAFPVVRHEQAEYVELVHTLLRMAAAGLPSLSHGEIACLVVSASRLPLVTIPKPWSVRIMTRVHHTISNFSPTGLAVMTWAFGKLGMRFRSDFSTRVLTAYKAKLESASPRALSLMAHGLVGVKVRPDDMWLGVLEDRVQQQLPRFSGWDLSMCLWGLVRLRCPVPRTFLTAALKQLLRRLPECKNHEAALSVWALGRLGYTFGSSSSSGGSQQQQHSKPPRLGKQQQQLLQHLQQRLQQRSMTPQDCTTLLYGLALMHCNPTSEWQQAALAAADRGLEQLDGQGLSNLLYAVGLLKWQPNRQWQMSFWKALVTQVQQVQPVRRHRQQQQHQQQQQRARYISRSGSSSRAVRIGLAGQQQQQQPGLSSKSWEQLYEAQRLLGWRLPLQQLQHLQEQQQVHRISQAQLGSWALQVQQHLKQQQYWQYSRQQQQQQQQRRRQQQQQVANSSSGSGDGSVVTVLQLRMLPPTRSPQPGVVLQSG